MSAPLPRVIFVNRVYQPSQAATAQLLTDLAESLAARSWPVLVIAAGEPSGPLNGVTILRTGPGEQPTGLFSRLVNNWRFIRAARRQLAGLLQPGDIVVLLSDPPLMAVSLARTVLTRGARLLHWIQDIYPEIVTAHAGAWTALPLTPLRLKRDAAWRAAEMCVTLGEQMARTLTCNGIAASQVALVPNWAPRELQAIAPAAAVAAQRGQWGLGDKFIVAYSGNLGRVHEFDTVLGAAEILQSHPDIVFLVIGTGPRLAGIRAGARKKKLTNLRFLPAEPRANLAVALTAADVQLVTLQPAFAGLVYPSKLAGALAAGRPVLFVGPPDGEIARFLRQEACGAAVAPAEAARLAETLLRWQADPGLRLQLQHGARVAYEKHFTLQGAVHQWEAILARTGPTA